MPQAQSQDEPPPTTMLLAPTTLPDSAPSSQATSGPPRSVDAPSATPSGGAPRATPMGRPTNTGAAYPYPGPATAQPARGADAYPAPSTIQPADVVGAYPAPMHTRTPMALRFPFVAPGAAPLLGVPQMAAAQAAPASAGFVTAQGDQLMLDGKPYHFLGVNATYLTLTYFLDNQVEPVIAYLAQTQGVNVIRLFFTPGQDPNRLQSVLDLGNKYGMRYIVALQNYHYNKSQSWFAQRYKEQDLPHLRETVTRFRDRPEILMWEMMNEPSCGPENGSRQCVDHMYNWAQAVSQEIRQLDPNHLISAGMTLRGWTSNEKKNYERIHALPSVDVVSIHRRAGKTSRGEMRVAENTNKPVFVGEIYYQAYNDQCRPRNSTILQKRADYIAKDLQWSFQHGLDGYLLWQHDPGEIPVLGDDKQWFCEANSYLAGDPVYAVFQRYLAQFQAGQGYASQPVGEGED